MAPRIPYIAPGTDPEMDPMYAQQFAEDTLPSAPANYQQPPDMRLFGARLNGAGLDEAARATLAALQNAPAQGNFGTGLLSGLAGGLAGGRVNKAARRDAANLAETKRVEGDTTARRALAGQYARDLAKHRWEMQRDAAKPQAQPKPSSAMVDVPGVGQVPATSRVGTRYLESKGVIPKPQADPAIQQMREDLHLQRMAALEQQRQQKESQDANDEQYASDIASLDPATSPVIPSGRKPEDARRITNLVNKKLREQKSPFTHQQLLTYWQEKNNFYGMMDRQQMAGFRQAAATAAAHTKQFEDFYKKYGNVKPQGRYRFLNKTKFQIALEGGMGQEAQNAAAALSPIVGALPTEIAKVLAGGRVPYEFEVRHAQSQYVDPFLSKKASASQVASVRRILRARIEQQQNALPYAGGKNNPYLLEVSPIVGWDDAEKESPSAAPESSGSWFDKNKPGGRK